MPFRPPDKTFCLIPGRGQRGKGILRHLGLPLDLATSWPTVDYTFTSQLPLLLAYLGPTFGLGLHEGQMALESAVQGGIEIHRKVELEGLAAQCLL